MIRLKGKWSSPVILIVLLLLLMALPAYVPSGYTVILVTNVLMYVVLTLSWAIFSGPTGYISLAPAAFFGVGVYASAILSSDLPLFVVAPIGGAASFVLAYLVGSLTLRLRGMYFTMFTFGLVELVRNLLHWWEVNITGTVGRLIISADNIDCLLCHGRHFSGCPWLHPISSDALSWAWHCEALANRRRLRPTAASTSTG